MKGSVLCHFEASCAFKIWLSNFMCSRAILFALLAAYVSAAGTVAARLLPLICTCLNWISDAPVVSAVAPSPKR